MALTSTFTTIAAGQTDADSPLDETLMDAMRQDIDVLYEWMGGPTFTPATSHDHDGVNSKLLSGAGGASLVFLDSTVITSSTSALLIDVFTTVYNNYLIKVNGLLSTHSTRFRARLSNDGGVSWDSSSNYFNENTTVATISWDLSTVANEKSQFNLSISGLNNSSQYPTMTVIGSVWTGVGAASGTVPRIVTDGMGKRSTSGDWDSLQLFFSSAILFQAEVRVYGFQEA